MLENNKSVMSRGKGAKDASLSPQLGFGRSDLLSVVVLLLLWLALSIPRLQGPIDLRWDASTYFILGTSIAQGHGYRLLNEPGEIQAVQYPPLLPLIVAAHERALGTSDYIKVGSALRIFYFVLSGIYLVVIYALARKLLRPLAAVSVGMAAALSFYSFLHPSDTLYAEMPFALVATLFLLCHRRDSTPLDTLAAGLLGAAAYLLRTAGVALLGAWIVESLLRRHYREAALRTIIAAIPVLLWQAYIWQAANSPEYHRPAYSYQRAPYYYTNVTYGQNSRLVNPFRPELGQTTLRQFSRRIIHNAAIMPLSICESAFVDSRFGLPGRHYYKSSRLLRLWLIGGGLCALIGAGLVAFSRHWFFPLYFAFTLGLIVLTPWPEQFWRYLAPLAPLTLTFLLYALLAGSNRLARWGKGQRTQPVAVLLAGLPFAGMLLIQVAVAVHFLRTLRPVSYYDASGRARTLRLLDYKVRWHSLDTGFEWVRLHAPSSAIIATTVPQSAYLRSGHRAVLPPFELDSLKATRLLDEVPVSYLVIDQLGGPHITEHYAAPLIASHPEDWKLVFTAPDGGARIYERVH